MLHKILFSTILSCFIAKNSNCQSTDGVAQKKFEDTLKVIEEFLLGINPDPQLKRIAAADFLWTITKIPYEGRVSFLGKETPSARFYNKCKDWYIVNKLNLVWDERQNKIILKE